MPRALASTIAIAVMAFAVPTCAQETRKQPAAAADAQAVRPFRIEIPEAALADLRRRIAATKWPERETVTDATQGVQLATMQQARALLGDRLRLAQGARRG